MNDIENARAAQYQKADQIRGHFFARHRKDIQRWHLEQADDNFLRRLTSGDLTGRFLLCNNKVRAYAAHAWVDALLDDYQQFPDRDRLWITVAWDTAVTWERAPVIDTVSLRNIANQHLRRSGLAGTGILEIDTWKEIAGERGKRISPHVHFYGWSATGEKINAERLAAEMCQRMALRNSLGAPSVVVKEVGKTAADAAALGRYMSKLPAYAKNPVPSRIREGYDLVQVEHAPGSVTRLIEVLSYLELGDVMFAIGDGKHVAKQVRDRVREECARKRRAVEAPRREMILRHWRRIRLANGNRKFEDCSVITRAAQRNAGEQDF